MSETEIQDAANKQLEIATIIRKANGGDKQSLILLRKELTGNNAQALIDMAGDLSNQVEQATLNAMLGDSQQGAKVILVKKLSQMRAELGWKDSPKLEQILIERVCQTWLYLHWLEMADAQAKNRPMELAKHESARIERAERRHLQAVKMLATVRKMTLPVLIGVKAELKVSELESREIGTRSRFDLVNPTN